MNEKNIEKRFSWKALIALFLSIHVLTIYELLGVHSPTLFDYLGGLVYMAVVAALIIPGAALIAFVWNWFSNEGYKKNFFSTYKFFLYINSIFFVAIVATSLFQSDDLQYIFDDPIMYRIATKDISPSDVEVLEKRLIDILPSRYSRILFDLDDRKITFLRGEPRDELVSFISENQGLFSMYSGIPSNSWLNNTHLENVTTTESYDGKKLLSILFTKEGGSILYKSTSQAIGKLVVMRVDEEILYESKISGRLSISINIDLHNGYDPDMYAILLNSGSLSKKISLQKI